MKLTLDKRSLHNRKEADLKAEITVLLIWNRKYMLLHTGNHGTYLCGKKFICLSEQCRDFHKVDYQVKYGYLFGNKGFLIGTRNFYHNLSTEKQKEMFDARDIQSETQILKRLKQVAVSGRINSPTSDSGVSHQRCDTHEAVSARNDVTAVYIKIECRLGRG